MEVQETLHFSSSSLLFLKPFPQHMNFSKPVVVLKVMEAIEFLSFHNFREFGLG